MGCLRNGLGGTRGPRGRDLWTKGGRAWLSPHSPWEEASGLCFSLRREWPPHSALPLHLPFLRDFNSELQVCTFRIRSRQH